MTQTYLIAGFSFFGGIVLMLIIHIIQLIKTRRTIKSLEGFLETEKLIKERFQKENSKLHELKELSHNGHEIKITELQAVIKNLDEDILLLQKSNEETEDMLKLTNPMVHSLKLKLLEANNTIARYKAQILVK